MEFQVGEILSNSPKYIDAWVKFMTTSNNRAEKAKKKAVGLCISQDFPLEV